MLIAFLLLVGAATAPEGYMAVTDNGAMVILYEDKTWMLYELPEGAEMVVSPIAVTDDSQFIFLTERKWKYILPEDTTGVSYDSITKPLVPYNRLSKVPHLRDIPNVFFSSSAAAKRQEGIVVLRLLVDVDGDVIDVKMVESSGYMELDNVATKNGWRAKFSPPEFMGRPVRAWVSMPIDFTVSGP